MMKLIRLRPSFGARRVLKAAAMLFVQFVSLVILTAPARAQETAKDFIEPRVTRAQFLYFHRQLGLDSEQRSIAEMMFSDYSSALDSLARRLDEQATEAGLKIVQDAMMGKARLSADELRFKRVAVLKVYQNGMSDVDREFENLVLGLDSILTPEQAVHFEPARRELHRIVYLHPRQLSADFQEYAGDGVDVLALVEQASKEGGELAALHPSATQTILARYEKQLDELLQRSARDYRDSKLLRKIAGIEKDSAALRDLEQAALTRWKELFQLNQNTVRQIGEAVAANLGDPRQHKWLDRFDQASFTWLYPRRKPDRQIDWIRQQSFPDELVQKAEGVYDGYLARRRELSRQAIDIMLRARLEFQTMLYAMMDPRTIADDNTRRAMFDELLKNSGEQTNLENITSSALEALLDATQRDQLRKATQGPEPVRRR